MKSEDISVSELMKLSGADGGVFALKLAIYFASIAFGFYLTSQGGSSYWIGIIVVGLAFAHGVELQHQVLHGSAFQSPLLNRVVGFVLGLPMLVSYSRYQFSHLLHHDKVGTPDDTEFFEFNTLSDNNSWIKKLSSFFLVTHYVEFVRSVVKSVLGSDVVREADKGTNARIRHEYLIMASGLVSIVCASLYTQEYYYLVMWLAPMALVTAPIHSLIEFPEHFGCNNGSPEIFENTRTVASSPLLTWFTNGNNYHVEHHMFPLVRPEKLSVVNRKLSNKIIYQNRSYSEFFMESL